MHPCRRPPLPRPRCSPPPRAAEPLSPQRVHRPVDAPSAYPLVRLPKEHLPAMTLSPTTTAASSDWASFRVLLEEQRADCARQRELALTESATALPDPVTTGRVARLLR